MLDNEAGEELEALTSIATKDSDQEEDVQLKFKERRKRHLLQRLRRNKTSKEFLSQGKRGGGGAHVRPKDLQATSNPRKTRRPPRGITLSFFGSHCSHKTCCEAGETRHSRAFQGRANLINNVQC